MEKEQMNSKQKQTIFGYVKRLTGNMQDTSHRKMDKFLQETRGLQADPRLPLS